jgi:hypothetical protein
MGRPDHGQDSLRRLLGCFPHWGAFERRDQESVAIVGPEKRPVFIRRSFSFSLRTAGGGKSTQVPGFNYTPGIASSRRALGTKLCCSLVGMPLPMTGQKDYPQAALTPACSQSTQGLMTVTLTGTALGDARRGLVCPGYEEGVFRRIGV